MIIDTSAVMAILLTEPDAEQFARAIDVAEVTRISAATFLETEIVAGSYGGEAGARDLDNFMRRSQIVIENVTEEQANVARQAYADFGKGRNRAGLNFGDCFSYALAKVTGEPLLFKGQDFRRTDVPSAL